MKTLRIINQNLKGCEQERNISLEGDDFEIVMKSSNHGEGENLFEYDMKNYYGLIPGNRDETIIGFVHGKTRAHPIRNYEVGYIVNDEGKTIKRIYGQYTKY